MSLNKKLLAADPRLKGVAERAGALPLRRREGGFEGLAAVITGQQISTFAAAAKASGTGTIRSIMGKA